MIFARDSHRTAPRRRRNQQSSLQKTSLLAVAIVLSALTTLATAQNAATNRALGSEAIVPMKQHTIHAPYVESDLQNKFWDFGGDAIVDTNSAVKLTQDKPSQVGWLWSRLPINTPNFEIQVEFRVDGKATGSHPYGDGFAIWLTEERAKTGPIFGNKDYFTGVGLMFDTFANARHPYTFPRISAINLNGVERYHFDRDGAGQEVAGCSFDFRRAPVATRARLTHVRDVFTSLDIHYQEWDTWENCFKLGNLTFPESPYLGMTAATGDVSDNHDIISVTTNSIVYKQRTRKELEQERALHLGQGAAQTQKSSGWFSSGDKKDKSKKKKKINDKKPKNGKGVATMDSGGHHYNGNAGQSVFTRAIKGFFGLLWLLIKIAVVVGVIGAGIYIFVIRKKKLDAKRF